MPALLLVDDQRANLIALRAVLEPLGYELVDASSGREALRLAEARQFAMVLLDVRMPGMDGIETAAQLRQREQNQRLPILFITAAPPEADEVRQGYSHGAADYLVKPFDPDILRAKVRALVDAQQAAEPAELTARNQELLQRELKARAIAEAARNTAEHAAMLKDQFLATLSHELRTPLMSILGWVRLLRMGKVAADPAGRALQTIERNALQQARLVEELLDVQRFAAGRNTLSFRDVAFARLVELVVQEVQDEAAQKHITLRAALPPAEEYSVFGDEDRLRQVLLLLLRNAVKFTPSGGNVRAVLSGSDSELLLTVSDDGSGMTGEFLKRVFEPFAQQDSRLSRQHGGFGLGLYTVRNLVEMHGGAVTAQSEGPGLGSQFLVTLPVRSRAARSPSMPAPPPPEHAGAVSLQGFNILAVDDDPDAQYLIATMLEQFGARVTVAGSAADATDALAGAHFDLLLSDISMAGEDGYSFIRRVRGGEANAQIPAVALTAHARHEDRMRALSAGFQAHLSKPIDPVELAEALAALLPTG